jgi:hypothetical protein
MDKRKLNELADKLGGLEPLSFDEAVKIWAEVKNKQNPNLDKGTQQTSWPYSGNFNQAKLAQAMNDNGWSDEDLETEALRRGLIIQPINFLDLKTAEAVRDLANRTKWNIAELLRPKVLIDRPQAYPAHRSRHEARMRGKDPRIN